MRFDVIIATHHNIFMEFVHENGLRPILARNKPVFLEFSYHGSNKIMGMGSNALIYLAQDPITLLESCAHPTGFVDFARKLSSNISIRGGVRFAHEHEWEDMKWVMDCVIEKIRSDGFMAAPPRDLTYAPLIEEWLKLKENDYDY